MRSHGHAIVWGVHVDIGRARGSSGWYQQLKEWWAARKSSQQQAKLAALNARWDAERETLRPVRAEAALEMAIAQGALSLATQPYSLIQ
jgi:hypothetical protein